MDATGRPTTTLVAPGERAARMWPFIATFVLGFVLAFLTRSSWEQPQLLVVAAFVLAVTVIGVLAAPFQRWSDWTTLVPVLALCVVVDLLRAASGGGSTAGYGSLFLIPVVWQALHRRQAILTATVAIVTVCNVAAIVLLESPVEVAAQWRSVILFSVVATTIGQTIHLLVEERSALLRHITEQARQDPLTGLPNRRVWDERLPELATDAARTGRPLAVAIVDLDHFKAFNDREGHHRGDDLLVATAQAWRGRLRPTDLLVRWGGEEFALLLPDTDAGQAAATLDRLQEAVPEGQSFSGGYAIARFHPQVTSDLERIVRAADDAMYRAKRAGRARSFAADLAVDPVEPMVRPRS